MPWNVSSFEWLRDVINALDVDPRAVLFVDNNQNNILMARSLGMRPIFVHSMDSLCDQLRKFYGEDPIQRGRGFLRANQKNMYSVTSRGFTIREVSRLYPPPKRSSSSPAELFSVAHLGSYWRSVKLHLAPAQCAPPPVTKFFF